jgi:hypothetical protein
MVVFLCGCGGRSPFSIKAHREYRETIVEALDSGWVDSKYPDEVLIQNWPELSVAKYGGRELRSYAKFRVPILAKGERVDSVSLNARLQGSNGIVYPLWIGVHRTTNDWRGDDLKWNGQPEFEAGLLGIVPYYATEPGPWVYWALDLTTRELNDAYLSLVMVSEEEVPSEISFAPNPFLMFITYR